MVSRSDADRYLKSRGRRWWYCRRVPTRFAHLDTRGTIRESLGTDSLEVARLRRDHLAEADDAYWQGLALAAAGEGGAEALGALRQRHKAAQTRALAAGFTYRTVDRLAATPDLDDLVERLLAVRERSHSDDIAPREAEALLGGAPQPPVRVSDAFEIYLREIAFNDTLYKSPRQRYSWEKTKRTSIGYFIDQVGDLVLTEITRDHALDYQRWWSAQVKPNDPKAKPVAPNTANRHIGNIRTLYTSYFEHIGEEERPNPFRGIHFKAKSRTEVPPFENDWVQGRILQPGALIGLNLDLQVITYMLIETGCRPSEIINLQPEDIVLEAAVPHIAIRARTSREIKTLTSAREIPLVGVALEAAKRARGGFPRYQDKSELFSANMMKGFRRRGLFPTPDHVIYSFRHAFEKRMQEANIDYGLRCLLMGHKTTRPVYGDGGSLAYRREELLKIAHPFSPEIFERLDDEVASR
ncbi:DUF6538 domain-containing protein [Parvularcula oceani]|uniref:DUF6538 domain-containing protein n=1 Tax=Parvularcula oceani TaxID=1247963 RepID=UPI0004E2808F